MPGVSRELAEHTLNIDPKFKPVKQFLVEVFHPEWLANPVLVLKKNGTWRMCVDYTDLNKAFPADPFALPVLIKSLMLRRVVSV